MDKRRRKAGGVTAKRSERKRQWGAKALAIVLFMAAGAVGGYLIGHAMSSGEGDPLGTVAWLVAAVALLVVACILQVVVHEAGHLVLGLATGYRFRSFRVGSLMLVEQDGRLCLKRLSIQGTGGQCLMGPPDLVDGRIPYRLYNLGGVLANTLVSLVAAALTFALPQRLAAIFFAFLALVGFVFALTNGLPLTVGGVNNDGKNLRSAGESPDALRAFWTILKVGEAQADDLRVKDMPAAWFAVPADAERLRNPLIASVAVLACNRLLDEGRTSESADAIRDLLKRKTGMLGLHRSLLKVDLAYCELMGESRAEEAERVLDADARKLMKAMSSFPSVLRTRYAQALLANCDEEAARRIREEFDRAAARYPYPSEIEGERELMDAADVRFRERAAHATDVTEEGAQR